MDLLGRDRLSAEILRTINVTDVRQVDLYNIATDTSTQLTQRSPGLIAAWSPAWSPDGTRVAFIGQVPTGLDEDVAFYYGFWNVVMTIAPDGSDLRQLTDNYFAQSPTWTPNSRSLLYANYGEGYRNYCPQPTYRVTADGATNV